MSDKRDDIPENRIRITREDDGISAARWIKIRMPKIGFATAQKLLRTGQIRLDGKRIASGTRFREGQVLRIPPQNAIGEQQTQNLNVSENDVRKLRDAVIYQDDDMIAFLKPPGLAVQGGKGLYKSLDRLLVALADDNKQIPKLVHRLDRDVGGVVLTARSRHAAAKLAKAFAERQPLKIYCAITEGVPKKSEGHITTLLDRKDAKTLYKVTDQIGKKRAAILLNPVTGRKHQLRRHLAHIGCPIVGDKKYGNPGQQKSTALHAALLRIPSPKDGRYVVIKAPIPHDMRDPKNPPNFKENDVTEWLNTLIKHKQLRRKNS